MNAGNVLVPTADNSGGNNTFIGARAGVANTTGGQSVVIGSEAGKTFTDVTAPIALTFAGGVDGTVTDGARKTAFEKFADSETVDVGLIMAGNASAALIGDLITIAELR